MGVARAWSRSEIKNFLPSLSHTENDYLSDVMSENAVSIVVPEI